MAWVNSDAILQQLPEYAKAESTFNVEIAGYRTELQKLSAQLDSAMRAYDQQQIVLSPTARTAKQDEIRQMQQRLDQRQSELNTRAQQRERELVGPVEARVKTVIEGLRAERNLWFIFDVSSQGSGVVAADRSLDVTSIVAQRLRTPAPGGGK